MICGEFANHTIASVAGPLPIFLSFSLKLLSAHWYWCPRKHNRKVWSLNSLPDFF